MSRPDMVLQEGSGWRTVPYLDRERVIKEIQ
jgi:hypothetical protein